MYVVIQLPAPTLIPCVDELCYVLERPGLTQVHMAPQRHLESIFIVRLIWYSELCTPLCWVHVGNFLSPLQWHTILVPWRWWCDKIAVMLSELQWYCNVVTMRFPLAHHFSCHSFLPPCSSCAFSLYITIISYPHQDAPWKNNCTVRVLWTTFQAYWPWAAS